MTSPTERILTLAAYLDRHRSGGVTLSEISLDVAGYDDGRAPRDDRGNLVEHTPEWEAIRKKVRRDLTDLDEQWGIDAVYDERSHEYRLAAPFLTARQRAALISAAAVVAVEGVANAEPGAIGSRVDDGTARVVVQLHEYVATLRDAIGSRTAVRFRHEGRVRVLEPWALGVWRNRWYVAGGVADHGGAMRRFRLDRVEPCEPRTGLELVEPAGAYEIPEWFDVDKAFDFDPNSWGTDAPIVVRVAVDDDHRSAFRHEFGGQIADDGRVELTVRHYESFRNRILGFRGHAAIVSPPEIVAMVRDHLSAIVGVPERGPEPEQRR